MSYHLAMYPVHFEVVLGGLYLKNVFQMGGGGLRGKKFMFLQEASNFSFFILSSYGKQPFPDHVCGKKKNSVGPVQV